MPKVIRVKLEGVTPLLQSRSHEQPKLNRELADAYERRTWRYKAHVVGGFEHPDTLEIYADADDRQVVIPGISFKRSLDEIAKYLGRQVPGRGKATYTKHFEAGVQCIGAIELKSAKGDPIKAADLKQQRIFVNADGVRGSGKRVHRLFPAIDAGWLGDAVFEVWDDLITEEVFTEHLIMAGSIIGVGAFRVRNGGFCGRFRPVQVDVRECTLDQMLEAAR